MNDRWDETARDVLERSTADIFVPGGYVCCPIAGTTRRVAAALHQAAAEGAAKERAAAKERDVAFLTELGRPPAIRTPTEDEADTPA